MTGGPRGWVVAFAVAVLVAGLVAVGLAQTPRTGDRGTPPPRAVGDRARDAAPPAIRALYRRPGALLRLDRAAFASQLRRLRGRPVVLNRWASWCEPCRREFPLLARASVRHAGRVAFLGLGVRDDAAALERFAREHPTVYPHVFDPRDRLGRSVGAGGTLPSTVVLDATGRAVAERTGELTSDADVDALLRPFLR